MKIAVIGWGSLVWAPDSLKLRGEWQSNGPTLPVEFARTSKNGRLTLVLTPGARPVPTLWARLDCATVEDAREALRLREGTSAPWIGSWPGPAPRHALGTAEISAWAEAQGLDAVVWTALRPRFRSQDDLAPSEAEAIAYMRSLDDAAGPLAREYVERAPAQVETAYRRAFEQELGWRQRS